MTITQAYAQYRIMPCLELHQLRVAPHGVVSLDDRIKDLHERYHDRYPSKSDRDFRQKCESQARIIESQIFRHTQLQATDITDRAVSGTINRLRNFNIG